MFLSKIKALHKSFGNKTILIFGLAFIVRLIYTLQVKISPDEAYYWDWTRFLSFGYFDHPPMIAWLVKLTTLVTGNTLTSIKLTCWLCFLGMALSLFLLSRQYLTKSITYIFLLALVLGTPFFGIFTLALTPDLPLNLFWALGLYIGYFALFQPSYKNWILLGIVAGLGLLSKYIFVLFFLSMAAVIIGHPKLRFHLKDIKLWIAFVISFLVFLPNIIWNAQHEWAAYSFQLSHGLGKHGYSMKYFWEYLGGQAGIVTPFIFFLIIGAIVLVIKKFRGRPELIYLVVFTALPLLFFGYSSLKKRGEANWPSEAYLSGFLLLAWMFELFLSEKRKKLILVTVASLMLSCALTFLITIHVVRPYLPLSAKLDMTKKIRGWESFAGEIHTIRKKIDPELTMPVCANKYQLTSLLGFYLPDQPRTWSLNISSRKNHYSLMNDRNNILNNEFILVIPIKKFSSSFKMNFEEYKQYGTVTLKQSSKKRIFSVLKVRLKKDISLG